MKSYWDILCLNIDIKTTPNYLFKIRITKNKTVDFVISFLSGRKFSSDLEVTT